MKIEIKQIPEGFSIVREGNGGGENTLAKDKYQLIYFILKMVNKYLSEEDR